MFYSNHYRYFHSPSCFCNSSLCLVRLIWMTIKRSMSPSSRFVFRVRLSLSLSISSYLVCSSSLSVVWLSLRLFSWIPATARLQCVNYQSSLIYCIFGQFTTTIVLNRWIWKKTYTGPPGQWQQRGGAGTAAPETLQQVWQHSSFLRAHWLNWLRIQTNSWWDFFF